MKHNSTIKKRVFTKKDFLSGDGMLTPVWGPSLWHFLHMMSFNYPVKPSDEDKKHYRDYIISLQYILPCRFCRENLTKNFKLFPMTNDVMKNRESFSRYIYELHEMVNKMLGKTSGLTYCDVRERYEHFRARCSDDIPKAFDIEKIKNVKNRTLKKTRKTKGKGKEKGCTEPLYGKYAKCVIKIVPQEKKCETMQIDKKCYKTKNVNDIL
jgi:hypothetical protein